MATIAENIVAKALSHVGEKEDPPGSNSGPEVDKYLAYVGFEPGNPWCAAFACYVVGMTLEQMGLDGYTFPHTASSGGIVTWGRRYGRIVNVPRPGDLGMVKDATKITGYSHTVIVVGTANGKVQTVEGNKGDGVNKGEWDPSTLTFVRPY